MYDFIKVILEEFMSQGVIARSIEFNAIPSLVNLMEVIFGRKQGPTKSDAVKSFVGNLLIIGGSAAVSNNPLYADAIAKVINATASALFPSGESTDTQPVPTVPTVPTAPAPGPTVVPPPPPIAENPAPPNGGWGVHHPIDETTEFDSIQDAIKALHDSFVLVLQKPNGKYIIYPVAGPYPMGAVQVYPSPA